MTKTHMVQVVVGGKILTMGGSGDEVHIQKVASCVNRMIQQLEDTEAYRALPADLKPVLIELNIADELIAAQDAITQLETDLQLKENELAKVKQSLVDTQMQLERAEGRRKR
ncbi:MAG: cell division protein ZapA [Clostridiales bacterium]|nr:cell division protein ZapA [Clostridiales bacterium]MCD8333595.1 cell division protein ZapA [Clostridiales bacterium]